MLKSVLCTLRFIDTAKGLAVLITIRKLQNSQELRHYLIIKGRWFIQGGQQIVVILWQTDEIELRAYENIAILRKELKINLVEHL